MAIQRRPSADTSRAWLLSLHLEQHQSGKLLTTIAGIGNNTAAVLVAELRDPARFESGGALAAYVGLCPGHKHSGKHQPRSSSLTPIGNRRVRKALWMPTLGAATQSNPWLMVFYRRLIARGKPPKVALIAAMHKLLAAGLLSREKSSTLRSLPQLLPNGRSRDAILLIKKLDRNHGIQIERRVVVIVGRKGGPRSAWWS